MNSKDAPHITVIGTGYLGATHAVCMADLGYQVLGVDTDANKISRLEEGDTPFFEPGLQPLLRKQLESGRLRFTTDYAAAAEFGDIHFLCVGTPQAPGGTAADLRYVHDATATLFPLLERSCLVVGKSTVPTGTARQLAGKLAALAPAGRHRTAPPRLAWNPEFLREGHAVADSMHPDRIVIGVEDEWSGAQLQALYRPIISEGTPVLVTDLATAELVKLAANAFLATKISFINAMAEICDAVGADVSKLSDALGHDQRIGRHFLSAGLGFGGGCLPKDIRAFRARAEELGIGESLKLLEQVDAINLRCRDRAVEAARRACDGDFVGRRVAVLGCAFKPDSDDIRDSPALDVARRIQAAGAEVRVHDPVATESAALAHPELTCSASILDALRSADVVLHLTEWAEYRTLDPVQLAGVVNQAHLVDARNALDAAAWRAAGWHVQQLGRP
ncbi:MAG TPA: UDP-glucose/GDP-mannose dehydrogenase family protein [Pseudonocardiaceae bacterium]|nr:UDP-glucose/GDP-mannose dehydrogenase family protein [Pseudonocardiaceae bacterium]